MSDSARFAEFTHGELAVLRRCLLAVPDSDPGADLIARRLLREVLWSLGSAETRVRQVELDWANDPAVEGYDRADDLGAATASRLGLAVEVQECFGPGGGWPVLRFAGPADKIDELVRAYDPDLNVANGDPLFYDVPVRDEA